MPAVGEKEEPSGLSADGGPSQQPQRGRLDALFQPRSIAVIGASRDPDSISGTLFHNICRSFRGSVFPVNPHVQEIRGQRVFASLQEVPQSVDLAVISVPADFVLDVARQCVAKAVKAIVVISAGFSETDEAGRQRERELLAMLRKAGIPLVGPNCLGLLNTDPSAPLNATFGVGDPPVGNVAICTQSGALGFVYPEYMRQWGLGISKLVSVGNKCDIAENALVESWERDPLTRVIQLYLESFQEPRQLLDIARRVSRIKPIVALKAGRNPAGTRAAGSHTAALASPDAAAEGLFKQAGVVRVATLEDLCGTTALLATQPLPPGRRVAVLTNAGGPAVLCADALGSQGFVLPELSPESQATLRRAVAPAAIVQNPIDLIGTTEPAAFRHCLSHLLSTGLFDAVIVIYVPRLPGSSGGIAQVIQQCARESSSTTIISVFMESVEPPGELRDSSTIPCFRYPEAAVRALADATEYAEWLAKPPGVVPAGFLKSARRAREAVEAALERMPSGGWLSPNEVHSLLESVGLSFPRWGLGTNVDEALRVAQSIQYPVVLKAVSPTVIHKSVHGGVALDIRNPRELQDAFERISRSVPDCTAILIQEFVPSGHEMMIGIKQDPAFGHLIGFGSGGVHVEAFRDLRCRLHPLTDRDAEEMIQESPALRVLPTTSEMRLPEVDRLQECLLKVSALATAAPQIREADFNPISVLPNGCGVRVLDARIFVSSA